MNKLYHSDTYRGQDFTNGIKHYKYLRKVKTPYGWRYIYDESELKKNEQISKDVEKQARNKGYSYEDNKGATHTRTVEGHGLLYSRGHSISRSLYSTPGQQTKTDKIKEARWKIYEKHAKQKMKDIPKRTISKGIAYISNLKYNMKKKWHKNWTK